MKKQTQAIHVAYERRDAYDSLSVPVYNNWHTSLTMRKSCRMPLQTRSRHQIILV